MNKHSPKPKVYPKPPERTWTEHYPELGTAPVSYESSISPEFYELERKAIFERAWLNVGRVEMLKRNGSYFTKELAVAKTSLIIVRGMDGEIRAFHNVCAHRAHAVVSGDRGRCAKFLTCMYHGWTYHLDGRNRSVSAPDTFPKFDRSHYGLKPIELEMVHKRQ